MASEMPPAPERRPVRWPDGVQLVRQLAMVAVVVAAWSGLFYGAMNLPAGGDERSASADARRDARRTAAEARADSAAEGLEPESGSETSPETLDPEPPTRTAEAAPPEPAPAAALAPRAAEPPAAEPEPAREPTPDPEPSRSAALSPTPSPADVPMEELTLDPLEEAAISSDDLGEVSFVADILPVFERRCIKCHGGLRDDGTPRLEEGLSLLTVEDVLAGSTWGSVVEPGDVAGSYLYELVESGDMPDNEPRLLPRELRLIAAWIRAGAPGN